MRSSLKSLLSWLRPFLRGSGTALILAGLLAALLLTAQAVTPLVVESILSIGSWDWTLLGALIALAVAQVVLGYILEFRAHAIASVVGTRIRTHVLNHTLRSRVLDQTVLVRPSIVSRHTSDVDGVTEAIEATLVSGIPGVIRLTQSLVLLCVIEWRAGISMIGATAIFLIARGFIGQNVVKADRTRLDARSRVSESVDEAVTAASPVRGLRLTPWLQERFRHRAEILERASVDQGTALSQLTGGARVAGLAGLVFVVMFAVGSGAINLAVVAAALLYVEAIVRSLEALPPWARALDLAVVSRMRIDQILNVPLDDPTADRPGPRGIDRLRDHLATGGRIGIVTESGIDADDVLRQLVTSEDFLHIPQVPAAFNASTLDHLRSLNPDLTPEEVETTLRSVGLTSVSGPIVDLETPLGPGACLLTLGERQRLTLAMALAAHPRVILLGPILALGDADTARELLKTLNTDRLHAIAVSTSTSDLAELMDSIAFVGRESITIGTHGDLLVGNEDYSSLWARKLMPDQVDLSMLGLDADAQTSLYARLVTEKYTTGEVVYRQGDPADRVLFIVSGHLEILTTDDTGDYRRVATLGPGNHCGDLRLTVGEQRAETARCTEDTIIRSLSRSAIATGMTGLLDRTPVERRIVAALLRHGPLDESDLRNALSEFSDSDIDSALALLLHDKAVTQQGDLIVPVTKRAAKTGAADILDKIGGLT